ncbi:hypothetical protein Poli38472_007885 [Pythium oligandrum]|uniref:ABC-2 type transporter transmembrane domain-containing protein n=1 Tax=Pythium oligandrum TaxID=41045 RepID=A0A8K1CTX3_PYTOL|nr:hypothetical protein Poli38472_007885 [Pythium oligandrum]|eukprot:TMW68213.1 hypothetical protein Poli38472_007885 [Pythium oligandrum]
MLVNTTALHGSVIFKALMDQALYRLMVSNGDTSVTSKLNLTVNSHPLPLTASSKSVFGSVMSFSACIFIMIAFAFNPASIVVFLVKEKQREHNSKHQQLVSGVSLPGFWLSNYIWDMMMYVILFLAAIIMIKAFDISALAGNDCTVCTAATYPAVVLLFILFGFAIAPFTYVMSYFIREAASAQTYTIMPTSFLALCSWSFRSSWMLSVREAKT